MPSPELKPCPFCPNGHGGTHGSLGLMWKEKDVGGPKPLKLYSVVCNCGANGPDAPTPRAAVAAWNRRAKEEETK